MIQNKTVSIKEIARLAGISIGTVDRVLHNRGHVSKKTEERIRRIIAKTGYRPNIFASRLSRAKLFRFAVLMPHPHQDCGFWNLPFLGMQTAAVELMPHNIQVDYHFFDKYAASNRGFKSSYQEILKELPDGLLMAPVVPEWMGDFIQHLPEGYPYVFFDTGLPNTRPISIIVQDSFQSGILSAKLMHLLVGEAGDIAIMQIKPSDYHLLERARGFRSYFVGIPGIRIHERQIDGDLLKLSYQKSIKTLLKDHLGLSGIYVTNAATFFAAECLVSQSRGKKIHVIGYDLIPENASCLLSGSIDFIINPRPEMQGYRGIYTLYRSRVLRDSVPSCQMMPIDIITRENYRDYAGQEVYHGQSR